jgi:hypothetical protein
MPLKGMATVKYRMQNEEETPPGGWRWRNPKTNIVISATQFDTILHVASRTLLNMQFDPSEAAAQIHDETAKALILAGKEHLTQRVAEVKRTGEQLRTGAKAAFLKWWRESPVYGLIQGKTSRGEAVFVGQVEGNRRALICAKCPKNVIPAGKGWLQNWTDGQMLKSVEGRKTESHDRLGVCEVCSCELRAAVWWQPDIIAATTRDAKFARDFPSHCWKRQIIQSPIAG